MSSQKDRPTRFKEFRLCKHCLEYFFQGPKSYNRRWSLGDIGDLSEKAFGGRFFVGGEGVGINMKGVFGREKSVAGDRNILEDFWMESFFFFLLLYNCFKLVTVCFRKVFYNHYLCHFLACNYFIDMGINYSHGVLP